MSLFLEGACSRTPRHANTPTDTSYLTASSSGTKVRRMKSSLVFVLSVLHVCKGQLNNAVNNRGLGLHRPIHQQSSPCWGGYSDYYDPVDEDGRKLLLVAGAAVGGAALGYHLGMKQKPQVIINNNVHPSPCVQTVGGGGITGGGILGHHPILSSILQGGLWNGGGASSAAAAVAGGGNRLPVNINLNRAIRQFNRAIRPLTSVFR